MDEDCNHNAIVLHNLVKKTSNRSATTATSEVLSNMIDAVHNSLLIRGDEHQTLSKCLEATKQCFKVLKGSSFDAATQNLMDSCMVELASRN